MGSDTAVAVPPNRGGRALWLALPSAMAAGAIIAADMYAGCGLGPLLFGLLLNLGMGFALAWLVPLAAFGIAILIALAPATSIPQPLTERHVNAYP